MRLPVYQHPSLTVLVDDSDAFLAGLQSELGAAVTSKAFTDTGKALAWMRAQHDAAPPEALLSASFCIDHGLHQQCGVTLDLDQIFHIAFRPGRFMLPTVLVVDYRMPHMNGVEFCAAIADLPCKKILLSEAGDEGAALDAFNRGLIDRSIRKSDDNALEQLESAICALQHDYFIAQSDALRALLELHSFGFISDPAVARLVRDVSRERGIVEHYLVQHPSGLLLSDASGRATLMVIETNQGMDTQHEVARDSGAPPSLLEAIEARCIIPYFRNGDGMYADTVGDKWYRYCEPARVCHGAQPYFWALFDLAADLLPQAAVPFALFQASHRGGA